MMQRMLNQKATKLFVLRALCACRPPQGYKQVHHIVNAKVSTRTRPYPWEAVEPHRKQPLKNGLTYFAAKEVEFEVKMEMLDHLKPAEDSKSEVGPILEHPMFHLAKSSIKYPGGPKDENMVYLADFWHLFDLCDGDYVRFELPKNWYCSNLSYIYEALRALQSCSQFFYLGQALEVVRNSIDADAAAIKVCIDDAELWFPHNDPQEAKAVAKKWVDKVDMMRKARGIPLLLDRRICCPCCNISSFMHLQC